MAKKQILVCCVLLAACGEPKPTASLGTTDAAPPAMDAQRQNDGTPVPRMDASTSDGTVPTGDMSSPTALDMGTGRDQGVPVTDTGSPINDGQPPPLDQGPTDAQQPDVTFVDAHSFDAAPPPMRVEGMPCPQAWGTRSLDPDPEGGWSARGTTEGAVNRGEGSCGGDSGQHIYAFTAPEDGSYAVEVNGDTFAQLGFAVVYVRTSCDDPATELACDARREPRAAVTLNLPAQQTVYIFVDGIRSGMFPTTGGYRLRVFERQVPVLSAVNAWMNPATASTSVDLVGTLGNVALSGAQYRFLDANGRPVPSRGQVDPLQFGLVFETAEAADGTTTFTGTLEFAGDVAANRRADVTQIEVAVYDLLGGLSAPRTAPVQRPRALAIGDHCDMVGARTACPDGAECFIRNPLVDPQPACHSVGPECPPEWTVTDLMMFGQPNGEWVYEGTLLRGNPPLERHGRGSCPGATGHNDLFSFTAPAQGRYRFETNGERGDTILWARTACGVEGPGAEIQCSDDELDLGRFSRIEADLNANQTVYVFVDSFGIGERGPYTLTVSRR